MVCTGARDDTKRDTGPRAGDDKQTHRTGPLQSKLGKWSYTCVPTCVLALQLEQRPSGKSASLVPHTRDTLDRLRHKGHLGCSVSGYEFCALSAMQRESETVNGNMVSLLLSKKCRLIDGVLHPV